MGSITLNSTVIITVFFCPEVEIKVSNKFMIQFTDINIRNTKLPLHECYDMIHGSFVPR